MESAENVMSENWQSTNLSLSKPKLVETRTTPPPKKEKRNNVHMTRISYVRAQSLLVLFGRNVLSPDPEASSLAGGGGRCLHHGRMSLARRLLYQIGSVSHFRVKRSK